MFLLQALGSLQKLVYMTNSNMQDYAIEFAENTYSCAKLIELLRNVIYLYTPLVAG